MKDSKKVAAKFDPTVFTCITLLTQATGTQIKTQISEMLEQMLATGLSPSLTTALREIQKQIPNLKKDINDGLLKILSQILMNQPWRHPGMPKSLPFTLNHDYDNAAVVLALETLAKFDVDGKKFTIFESI